MTTAHGERELERVESAHAALVAHLDEMAGTAAGDPTVPSNLPGWTRGHVLTHLARNADSFVRVLRAAEHGDEVTRYAGGVAGRNADIARGAGRSWAELVDDVRTSAAALETRMRAQTRWDLASPSTEGERVPHALIPSRRLREVNVHHVDLGDAGYTAEKWPADYVREELRLLEMVWNARRPMGATGLPEPARRAPPLTRLLWLMGRVEIDGLAPAQIL